MNEHQPDPAAAVPAQSKPPGATLVIPDVHNDFALAESIIASLAGRFDQVVFLGDYFDDFDDTPDTARNVAQWLKHSVEQPNRVHLVGNHDLSYLHPNSFTFCPGFSQEKMHVVAPFLNLIPLDRFLAALETHGWLLSHAGMCPSFIQGNTTMALALAQWANGMLRSVFAGGRPWLFAAGAARGGPEPVGGVTWCDWDQEFSPTTGVHQIVGHTPAANVRTASLEQSDDTVTRRTLTLPNGSGAVVRRNEFDSTNICLDTRLRHVALLIGDSAVVIPSSEPGHALSATLLDELVAQAQRMKL